MSFLKIATVALVCTNPSFDDHTKLSQYCWLYTTRRSTYRSAVEKAGYHVLPQDIAELAGVDIATAQV